tara:strand:- start:144 stop:323 length:180 start_codon:yes stop_codon:yes gene_type:complete
MILANTEISQFKPRLKDNKKEGTLADIETVPATFKVTLDELDIDQLNLVAEFVKEQNRL